MKHYLFMPVFILFCGCESASPAASAAPPESAAAPAPLRAAAQSGPTVDLRPDQQRAGSAIEHFMYFIPLISPVPVTMLSSTGSTQRVYMQSVYRKTEQEKIALRCAFEIRGAGFYRNVLDQSLIIGRHTEKMRKGVTLENLLGHILFSGAGSGEISAEGVLVDGKPRMDTVRIGFRGKNGTPVSIGLFSVRLEEEQPARFNEMRVDISTLIFTRAEEKPKMRVSVMSVKDQSAPDSFWENFKGAVKGRLANLVIPPVSIALVGNSAILDFATAIYSEAPEFTFPPAKNLNR